MREITIHIQEGSETNCDLFLQQITDAAQSLELKTDISVSSPFLWISTKNGHFKLYLTKCRFIETDNRKLIFHYLERTICKSGKISSIIEKLPKSMFFRCNNSYIVNLRYISHIVPEGGRYNLLLTTGEILPLSRSKYQKCLRLLKELHKMQ